MRTPGSTLVLWRLAVAALLGLPISCAPPAATASVYLVESTVAGKGIFVVSPQQADKNCTLEVQSGKDEATSVACNSQYVIGCDIDLAADQPFCQLVREVGVGRESAYPVIKR